MTDSADERHCSEGQPSQLGPHSVRASTLVEGETAEKLQAGVNLPRAPVDLELLREDLSHSSHDMPDPEVAHIGEGKRDAEGMIEVLVIGMFVGEVESVDIDTVEVVREAAHRSRGWKGKDFEPGQALPFFLFVLIE